MSVHDEPAVERRRVEEFVADPDQVLVGLSRQRDAGPNAGMAEKVPPNSWAVGKDSRNSRCAAGIFSRNCARASA
jgi:hypothetical protein